MTPAQKVKAREGTVAAIEKRQPFRKLQFQTKDFSSAEQAVPIRVVYGTAETSGTYITPVFGLRSEPVKSESSK
jgi:hypothetical protein